jgi:hypothetical protein
VTDEYDLDEVYTVIVQPFAEKKLSGCLYMKHHVEEARGELLLIMARLSEPGYATFNPGHPQCDYCKGSRLDRCQAHRDWLQKSSLAPMLSELPPPVKWTGEQWARYLDVRGAIKKWFEARDSEAKLNIASIPGYGLKPGRITRTVSNPQECFDRVHQSGVSLPDFMKCVSVGKEKLENAVRAATGFKGEQLDMTMRMIYQGITEEKQSAPEIVRNK